MRRAPFIVSFAFIALALTTASAFAQTNGEWTSEATGKSLSCRIIEPDKIGEQPLPVIVYLENLAAPRVGSESDESILQDFHKDGYLVLVLDFAHEPQARVPFINRDLAKLRADFVNKKLLSQYKVDAAHIFIVPSGCRLKRDVLYYPDPKRPLAMDIIYPSHPEKPPGAIIEFSCDNENRFGNTSLWICSDTILDAEATEGFAVAMADHPVPPPYKGIDPMPDCAWKIKAAVRTLRAEGDKLGLSGKIVLDGFSRGSGMALMLVTTMGMKEFEGHGENPDVSSDVQGAVVMSGRFTYLQLLPNDHMIPRYNKAWGERDTHLDFWRKEGAMDYLQKATLPLFLTINCTEGPDAQLQMTELRKKLAELGSDEVFMMDRQPRGHKVTLVREILSEIKHYFKLRLN